MELSTTKSPLIIGGPSGVGKGTIIQMIMNEYSIFDLSVSSTSRKKRDYETEGKEYHFIDREQFQKVNFFIR